MKKDVCFFIILGVLILSCHARTEPRQDTSAPEIQVSARTQEEVSIISEEPAAQEPIPENESGVQSAQWKPNMDPLPQPRQLIKMPPGPERQPREPEIIQPKPVEEPPPRRDPPKQEPVARITPEPPPPPEPEPPPPEPEPEPEPPPPEPEPEPPPPPPPPEPEPAFDPGSIAQETFDTTKLEVQQLISSLNGIIKAKDFNAWRNYLGEEYLAMIGAPGYLQQISDSPALKSRKIVVKDLAQYFTYVVVPSRANDRVDDIEFISPQRVKAYTIINTTNRGQQRLRLYDLEKIGETWKIIN